MAAIEVVTYKDIVDEVTRRSRQNEDDDVTRNKIKGYVNMRLAEVSGRQKWKWRKQRRTMQIIGKYETGTVATTNGSRSIVFTGASITEDFKGRGIFIGSDEESYRMISVDVANQSAILDTYYNGTTSASTTFKVFKDAYGLWPDFEGFDDIVSHYRRRPIFRKGPSQIQEMTNRAPRVEGKVRCVTTAGLKNYEGIPMGPMVMGEDFMGNPKSKRMVIYPAIADENYILPITYIKKMESLDADDDEPLMPVEDRIILVYGALADLYETLKDNDAFTIWEQKFAQKLQQMLSDHQEDDDYARLYVPDIYRRDITSNGSSGVYVGSDFDRE